LEIHRRNLTKEERRERVALAMARVQLDGSFADRKPHQLSGGQAQRVALGRAIVNAPELLVLDEPTSALDVSVQAQILELLEELSAEQSLSWVFITHDLGVAAEVCDRAVVVYRGAVVESGAIDAVLGRPEHGYTRQLVDASLHVGDLR
jgi:peptide/nickel transport system ATP-binding protein